MQTLVVLPTYKEAENIATVLRQLRQALPDASVLVVDDSSPDGTAAVAMETGQEIGSVEVLSRPGKAGLGSAYRDGFRWGLSRDFDAFVEMDSDLSHDPLALPDLLAPLSSGAELVVGSRYIPGGSIPNWATHRWLISRGGNLYAAWMLGLPVVDSTSGFRCYAASVLRQIDLERVRADSYGFQIEMVYRAVELGAKVVEVPICFVDRVHGESKMSTYTVVEALGLVTWWGSQRLARKLRTGLRQRRLAATSGLHSDPGSAE